MTTTPTTPTPGSPEAILSKIEDIIANPPKELKKSVPDAPKKSKEEDLHAKAILNVLEVLDSDKGRIMALKLFRKDDKTTLIYQGLRANIWGRIAQGKLTSYNSRLTRLLTKHPATKRYEVSIGGL